VLLSGGRDKVVVLWALEDAPSPFAQLATVPVFESVEALLALPHEPPPRRARALAAAADASPLAHIRFLTAGEAAAPRVWAAAGARRVFEAPPDPAAALGEGGFTAAQLLPRGGGVMCAASDCRLLFFTPPAEGGRFGAAQPELRLSRTLLGNVDQMVDAVFLGDCDPGRDGDQEAPAGPPRLLAIATNSAALQVLDSGSLACVCTLHGHADTVLCLDAAPAPPALGGCLLASGGKDRTLRLWHVPRMGADGGVAPACLAASEGHAGALASLAFGNAGALLLTGGADKLLKLWDAGEALQAAPPATAAAPRALRVLAAVSAHDKEVSCCAIAPGGALGASGGADRLVKLWTLPSLAPRRTLRGHGRGVWAVAFSPIDQVLASCSGDKSVRLWALASGDCLRSLQGHASAVLRVAWLSRGTQLASAGADGCLKLWSIAGGQGGGGGDGEAVWAAEAHDGKAWALAVAADGAHLLSGGADGCVRLWRDDTARSAEAAWAARELATAHDARLARALRAGDVGKALRLALQLGRPAALHGLLARAPDEPRAEPGPIRAALARLPPPQLSALLALCVEWNSNSRSAEVAQRTLGLLFRTVPASRLARLPGAPAAAEALAAYTRRHAARLDRLLRASFILDFTLQQQGALLDLPEEGERDAEAARAAEAEMPLGLRVAAAAAAAPRVRTAAGGGESLEDDFGGEALLKPVGASEEAEEEAEEAEEEAEDGAMPGWGGTILGDAEEEEEAEEAPPPARQAATAAARKGRKAAAAAEPEAAPAKPKPARKAAAKEAPAAAVPELALAPKSTKSTPVAAAPKRRRTVEEAPPAALPLGKSPKAKSPKLTRAAAAKKAAAAAAAEAAAAAAAAPSAKRRKGTA